MRSDLTELDMIEILRRRAQEMHQAVDNWFLLTAHELNITPPPEEEPVHTFGISFEPGVQVEVLSLGEESYVAPGIYATRPQREVEVLPAIEEGMVQFELVDSNGDLVVRSMSEVLFHELFATQASAKPASPTSYGLHPVDRNVALRYNPDGSITRGRFDNDGSFVADE